MTCSGRLEAAVFIGVKKWKLAKWPSPVEWRNKVWCSHTVAHSSTRRRNEQLHARSWTNFTSLMLSERSQRQKDYVLYVFIHVKRKNGQNSSMLVEVRITVTLGGEVTRRKSSEFC